MDDSALTGLMSNLQLASQYCAQGNTHEALPILKKYLEQQPDDSYALRLLATCYYHHHQHKEAAELYIKIIQLSHGTPEDYINLAQILYLDNDFIQAEMLCLRAVNLQPNLTHGIICLADIYNAQGKITNAVALLETAIHNQPNNDDLKLELFKVKQETSLVIAIYKKKIMQIPELVKNYVELAKVYMEQMDLNQAEFYLYKALAINNEAEETLVLLGKVAYLLKKWKKAEYFFRKTLAISPNLAQAHVGLAFNFLIRAKFKKGWAEWEWRNYNIQFPLLKNILNTTSLWKGEVLTNKKLFIFSERHAGNVIQFLRYIPLLKKENIFITLLVSPAYVKLVESLKIVDVVMSSDQLMPINADYYLSLFSIPYIKKWKIVPPIHFPHDVTTTSPSTISRIGICWEPLINAKDHRWNSIKLPLLLANLKNFNGELYSLQTNMLTPQDIACLNEYKVSMLTPHSDFAELIPLIATLDIVITVDNDIAHIAASMGKPTWVLLPASANWVYGTQTTTTLWYPKMRLFHQEKAKNWDQPLNNLVKHLIAQFQQTQLNAITVEGLNTEKLHQLVNNEKLDEAEILIKEILHKYPKNSEILHAVGIWEFKKKNTERALYYLKESIKINPSNSKAHNDLGTLYNHLYAPDKAITHFIKSLDIEPLHYTTWRNLAITYLETGNIEQAEECFQKTLRIVDEPESHLGLGLLYLYNQDYARGWEEYEYRFQVKPFKYDFTKMVLPYWKGEDLTGKRIYILPEQGIGDMLQMVRFIKLLKQRYNVTVLLGCNNTALLRLYTSNHLADLVCGLENVPMHDYFIPIMSLPRALKIHNKSQFMPEPYLHADPVLIDYWRELIKASRKVKIGICWKSSSAYTHNDRRNCSLENFLFLQDFAQCEIFSLQKGVTDHERTLLANANFINLEEQLQDFADTAAAIHQLNLVLTIDTALLHLAGALGKKTFAIMSLHTEWRHSHKYTHSLWYKDMHFYRQTQPGDWASAFKALKETLMKRLAITN